MERLRHRERLTALVAVASLGTVACDSTFDDAPVFCGIEKSIYEGVSSSSMLNKDKLFSSYNVYRIGNNIYPEGLNLVYGDESKIVPFDELSSPMTVEVNGLLVEVALSDDRVTASCID